MEEQWRWRIASIVIASPIVVVPICLLFRHGLLLLTRAYLQRSWVAKPGFVGGYAVCAVLCVAYLAARFYIVVECFLNLAHLPLGVYNVPAWSRYIPHLSAG
jgi:hypothetical protein